MDVNIKKAFRVIDSQKDNLYVNLKGSLLESKANNDVAVYMLVPTCLLYTSPSPRDRQKSRMPSSA